MLIVGCHGCRSASADCELERRPWTSPDCTGMSDALAGLKHLSKWKKMAIVSDQKGVEKITDIISPVIPGESKGFSLAELAAAKNWVSSEN